MMTGHRLRLASHWRRLDSMERKYDGQFAAVFDALRELIAPPEPDRKVIGFRTRDLPRSQRSGKLTSGGIGQVLSAMR